MKLAALLLAASALVGPVAAQSGDRSLINPGEAVLLAQGIAIPPPQLDIPLRGASPAQEEQIALLRSTIRNLTESLALANNEAEVFKRQANDLALRLEALGISGLEGRTDKVEQRLLGAVRELRAAQERIESYRAQLVSFVETTQLVANGSEGMDPGLRMQLEAEIRKTNELLGAASAPEPSAVEATISDATVADFKADLSLVIANVGERHGVKLGMPFQVLRDGKIIASVKVVDVRDRISGAIVQNLENEKNPIKIGDRLKVEATR